MNEQTARLFEAAKVLHNLTEPHQIAKRMHISQQTLKNWESRGISDVGLLDAEQYIGCSAIWLRTGKGDMCRGAPLNKLCQRGPIYDVEPVNKTAYVIDGIRGLLHLGGYSKDCLGTVAILRASLMSTPKPDLFDTQPPAIAGFFSSAK
jgi:hypothetical protein